MKDIDTKSLILDAAEKLFAQEGFHRTSLRAITGEAGVNLAAVNYHFGSKEALLQAVFERRLVPLNEVRMRMLDDVGKRAREEGRKPDVRAVLTAFVEPTIRFRESTPGFDNVVTLVARAIIEPDATQRGIFHNLMMPVFERIFSLLKEANPDMPSHVLMWKLHFVLGSVAHTLRMWGCCEGDENFKGVPLKLDADTLISLLMDFLVSGMKA